MEEDEERARKNNSKKGGEKKKTKSVEREDIANNLSILPFTHICKWEKEEKEKKDVQSIEAFRIIDYSLYLGLFYFC